MKRSTPEYNWDWPHLAYVRERLEAVTAGWSRKLMIAWPPQHAKTESVTVRYPLYRMLRNPGIRAGVACYNQRFTNKQSRKTRRLARRLGLAFGEPDMVDEWNLSNGSTFIARGAGAGIAGEPLDLLIIDDPFKNRQEADSQVVQERVHEWYMDDVTPRIQKAGAVILIHTRWGPADLIGRILESEEASEWEYVRLPALAETQDERDAVCKRMNRPTGEGDPLGRLPGEPLCPDRFDRASLEGKRRVEGVGFESVYQQNPILRGGSFFQRNWFEVVDRVPEKLRLLRYWDLANSRKDSACYTAGVLMAKAGEEYYVLDVVRGRWSPAERNDVMLNTAKGDATRSGFDRTWFESPVFDTGREASKAIIAKLAGYPVRGDEVSGSKEVRAEPYADAARGGLVKLVAGPWVAAYLTELEAFPKGQNADQVDSSSGAFNKLARGGPVFVVAGR